MSQPKKRSKHGSARSNKRRSTIQDDDQELAEIMAEMEPTMRVPPVSHSPERDAEPAKNTTNDAWAYTLNNYTPEEEAKMRALHLISKQVRYHVFGHEIGENGTPHLQGFITFTNRKKFTTVKKLLGDRRTN